MTTYDQTLQPDDYSKFTCIASACEDSCCCGWKIGIDQTTYDKYKTNELPELKSLFEKNIVRLEPGTGDYAEIRLSDNICPFLNEQRLCKIQNICGESALSQTCGNFPRNMNLVDGTLERSLNLSCPEAARIMLLDPLPMQFAKAQSGGVAGRLGNVPVLNTFDRRCADKPYEIFHNVRQFAIDLVQNRKYVFEDRLIILGLFCNDLDRLSKIHGLDKAENLLNRYKCRIRENDFESVIKTIPLQPAALLKVLMILIEYRLKTGITGKRFCDCFAESKEGLRYLPDITDNELAIRYSHAKSCYYDHFMSRHEFIYENYFVNYLFKTLFPFGPQQSPFPKEMYMVPKGIFIEYFLLVFHYAMIKNLLIGISGFYKNDFGEEQIIRLIQSFDKNIGRDIPYLQRMLQFCEENKMENFACTAMLIKN